MVGPRRGNHEGSPRHRKDGRWEWRVMLGGKSYSAMGATRAEAQTKYREIVDNHRKQLPQPDRKITLDAWLVTWLDVWIKPNKAASTYRKYAEVRRIHLESALGKVRLVELRDEHVKRYLNVKARTASAGTMRVIMAVLNGALDRAVMSGKIHTNVARRVDVPKVAARPPLRIHPLTDLESQALFAAAAGHRYEAAIHLALNLGLRASEILGLVWGDIDWERGIVNVRAQLDRHTKERIEPKDDSGRPVGIPPDTMAVLTAHLSRQKRRRVGVKGWDARDFVLSGPGGRPLDYSGVRRAIVTVIGNANLPPTRVHDLRHSFATGQIEGGEDLAVVALLLGHKRLATTKRYTHMTDEIRRRTVDRQTRRMTRKAQ